MNIKNRYNTIQYDFKVKNVKRKTPLITVAGIALKGQADLNGPLRGAGITEKMKKENRKVTVVVISTKHGLYYKNMIGRDEEGS